MTRETNNTSHSCLPSFLSYGRTVSRHVFVRTSAKNTSVSAKCRSPVDNSSRYGPRFWNIKQLRQRYSRIANCFLSRIEIIVCCVPRTNRRNAAHDHQDPDRHLRLTAGVHRRFCLARISAAPPTYTTPATATPTNSPISIGDISIISSPSAAAAATRPVSGGIGFQKDDQRRRCGSAWPKVCDTVHGHWPSHQFEPAQAGAPAAGILPPTSEDAGRNYSRCAA